MLAVALILVFLSTRKFCFFHIVHLTLYLENYILLDILKTIGSIVTFFVSTPRFLGSENIIVTKLGLFDVLLLCNHQPQDGR